jgi:hypothetical protein
MALLFVDSFPYSTFPAKWTSTYIVGGYDSGIQIETTSGRFGGRWLHLWAGNVWVWAHTYVFKTLPASAATLCCQFGFKPLTTSATSFFLIRDGETNQVYLSLASGILSVYNGDGTLIATASSYVLSTDVWHQVEFKVTIHGSAGTVYLRVNGLELINLTDQDTQNSANATANAFAFHASVNYHAIGISDIIIMDTTGDYCNDLLGSRMVELKVPTADGNYSQFTPSAGDNWQNVDEVPPDSDTTYNSGDVDAIDTFDKADIANPSATIDAVVCTMFAKSNDGGSAQVTGAVRSGGVDAFGSGIPVPSSFDYLSSIVYVDPDTDAPFTAAGINAAEFGYKRTA